jgi:hypothetical protein
LANPLHPANPCSGMPANRSRSELQPISRLTDGKEHGQSNIGSSLSGLGFDKLIYLY